MGSSSSFRKAIHSASARAASTGEVPLGGRKHRGVAEQGAPHGVPPHQGPARGEHPDRDIAQARGEPLIGVAGKISDGFFIIALNNIDQAVQNNLSLLGSEQWIDIPLAYQSGRRALISIEKGIPGDRVFKEAMDAWAAKSSNVSSAG